MHVSHRLVLVILLLASACPPSESPTTLRARARDAYRAKDFALCAELFARAKGLSPDGAAAAYEAACCLALAGDVASAFTRLDQAVTAGYFDHAHMLADADLERLRGDARFAPLLEHVRLRAVEHRKTMNAELANMHDDDQLDRVGEIDWATVAPRDEARRKRVAEILAAGGAKTADDYFHAAMVFQHGNSVADFRRAHELALQAAALNEHHPHARWLAAAAKDRELVNDGKPQLYGTQFRSEDGVGQLYPVDPSITDEERARWDVPALSVAKQRAEAMNKARAQKAL